MMKFLRSRLLAVLVFAFAAPGALLAAGLDMALVIPGIDGTSAMHAGAIDILSFSFGVSNPASGREKGPLSGAPNCSEFNAMMKFGTEAPQLFVDVIMGTRLSETTVTGYAAGTNTQKFTLRFTDVLLTSLQQSASSGGDDTPTQSLSFAWSSVTVTVPGVAPQTFTCPAMNGAPGTK